jgi:hypothetical protein
MHVELLLSVCKADDSISSCEPEERWTQHGLGALCLRLRRVKGKHENTRLDMP